MKYYNLYSINAYFRICHLMRLDTKNQQKLQEKVRFDTISPSSHRVHVKGEQRLECLCSLENAINCNSIYLFIFYIYHCDAVPGNTTRVLAGG